MLETSQRIIEFDLQNENTRKLLIGKSITENDTGIIYLIIGFTKYNGQWVAVTYDKILTSGQLFANYHFTAIEYHDKPVGKTIKY